MAKPLSHIEAGTNILKGSDFREFLNGLVDAINALQRGQSHAAPPIIHDRPFIPVRIDGFSTTSGYYKFDEVEWDDSAEEWSVKSGGVSETDMGEIRAIGSSLDTGHQTYLLGRVVYVMPRHAMDGSGKVVWEFTPPACESFWAKITGNAANGTNRWKYAWTEVERTSTAFQDLSGGRSGTTSSGFAINGGEANNDGTGVQGHGVDIDGDDYPAGFEVQPIQGDPVVRMYVEYTSSGTAYYTFYATNADDGTCEAA